jgi:hypothetical protein
LRNKLSHTSSEPVCLIYILPSFSPVFFFVHRFFLHLHDLKYIWMYLEKKERGHGEMMYVCMYMCVEGKKESSRVCVHISLKVHVYNREEKERVNK